MIKYRQAVCSRLTTQHVRQCQFWFSEQSTEVREMISDVLQAPRCLSGLADMPALTILGPCQWGLQSCKWCDASLAASV